MEKNDIAVMVHKTGDVTDTMTGKAGDGLVVSFGGYVRVSLLWKNFKQNRVVGRGKKMCDVVVKLTLKKESGNGNDYSVVQFALVGSLDDQNALAMRKLRSTLQPQTRRVALNAGDYDDAIEGGDTLPDSNVAAFDAPAPADDELPM